MNNQEWERGKEMKLDKSHRTQDGCWNCKFLFRRFDFDNEKDCLVCCQKGKKRPLCPYDMEDYCPSKKTKGKTFGELAKVWNAWAKGREVTEHDTCDNWALKEEGSGKIQ